jgi:hypothetical protein
VELPKKIGKDEKVGNGITKLAKKGVGGLH